MKQKAAVILFNFANNSAVQHIVDVLSRIFSVEWKVIHAELDPIDFFSPPRDQYYSTKILERIIKKHNDEFEKIIVLTDYDLFVPILTFVFGEAQLTGKAAIVSSCRLYQEFYGLPTDDNILLERLEKEILHELGHTYGLRHCHDWNCVMHSSSNIDEIDIKPKSYCKSCVEKIPSL
jgi:archaemetzincin